MVFEPQNTVVYCAMEAKCVGTSNSFTVQIMYESFGVKWDDEALSIAKDDCDTCWLLAYE